MEIEITHEEALGYPEQYAEIMKAKARSKSQDKGVAPEAMTWSFNWCQFVKARSFQEVLAGVSKASQGESSIEDLELSVGLKAEYRRLVVHSETPIFPYPETVLSGYRKQAEESRLEKERYDALSPEEQQAELDELLGALQGMGGFVGVVVPKEDGND